MADEVSEGGAEDKSVQKLSPELLGAYRALKDGDLDRYAAITTGA